MRSRRRARARLAVAVASVMGVAGAGIAALPAGAAIQPRPVVAPARIAGRSGKLSPRLSQLARTPSLFSTGRAAALSLAPSGAGSLVREPGGKLLVQIRVASTSSGAVARLRALGARVVNVSAAYSTVTAAIAPGALAVIAADRGVIYVSEVLAPMTAGIGARGRAGAARPATGSCNPAIPEGDTLMNVATARVANSLDGAGETIGILSDSFNTDPNAVTTAAQDIATGDLPGPGNPCGQTTPVAVQADYSGPNQTDEGRAVAELAHAMAPAAHLAFATSSNGQLDFAGRITALRTTNHASVIVDDSEYIDEPFFQDGPVANAANAASAAGVPYFTAAGNSNVIVGGHNVSSYEAPAYRNTTCPPSVQAAEPPSLGCHDFDPTAGTDNTDDITVAPGGGFGLDLQWAQPWGAVTNDYDMFVLNSTGSIVAASTVDQSLFQEPVEFLDYTNASLSAQTVKVVIVKFSGGADSRMKFVMLNPGGVTAVQYNVSNAGDIVGPTIFGHNGAATVGSTAAIPYNNANTSEPYSSRGPVTHYYQRTPSTTALGSPSVITKPDFAATDAVKSRFGQVVAGVRRFAGTSAAVSQAAGIGALLEERDPALTPAQIMTTLSGTARAVSNNGGVNDVGGGYLDATAALASVVPFPGVASAVTATNGDSQAMVQWSAAPSNPNFPVTSYTVTPTKDGVPQAPIVTGTGTPGLLVTGLTNGSSYTFTVTAVNANGTGAESAPSSAIDLGVPDAPTAVVPAPGNGQAQLTWTAAPASGLTITGYEVTPFIGAAAQSLQSFAGTATAQTVTGLTNGTAYTFKVAAIDSFTTGPQSTPSPVIVVGAPVAPAPPTFTYNGSTVTVSWTAPASDNGSAVTSYNLDTEGTGGSVHSFGAGTTQWVATGLSSGYPYTFAIQAVNANGTGPYSALSKSVDPGTPISPAPPTPTTSGNGSATLSWHPPITGPAADTGYSLNAYVGSDVAATVQFSSTATSQVFTGLTNGTSYRFTVAGVDGFGVGQESALSTPLVVGLPGAPTAVTAAPGNGSASVHWTAGSSHGSAITGYVVTPYYGSAAQSPHTFNSSATTETVSGLVNARAYTFRVAAINASGTGPKSSASAAIRVGTPRAPTSVHARGEVKSAKVHWTAPASDGASITGYVVTPYLGSAAQAAHTFRSTATTEVVHGLSTGHTYTFKVAAVNSRGTGAKSAKSNSVKVT